MKSFSIRQLTFLPLTGLLLMWLMVAVTHAQSDSEAGQSVSEQLSFSEQHLLWDSTLDKIEEQIHQEVLHEDLATKLRIEISKVSNTASDTSLIAKEKLRELQKLLSALGPLPQEGEPEEAPEVIQEREDLDSQLREMKGHIKQTGLIIRRCDILLHQIAGREFDQIIDAFGSQDLLPLDPRNWLKAGEQFFAGYQSLRKANMQSGYRPALLVITPLLVIAITIAVAIGKWVRRRLFVNYPRIGFQPPNYSRKLVVALIVGFSRGLVPVVVMIILYILCWNYGLREALDPQYNWPRGLFRAVLVYLFLNGLIRAVFSPSAPSWNLAWLGAESTRKIVYLMHLLILLFAVELTFKAILHDTGEAPEFHSIYSLIKNSLYSLVLFSLSKKALWERAKDLSRSQADGQANHSLAFWPYLRLLTAVAAASSLICSLLGFHNLADFIIPRIILTNILAAVFVSFRSLIREALSYVFEKETPLGHSLRSMLSLKQKTSYRISFWIMTFLDLVAILLAGYLMLVLWNLPHRGLVQKVNNWFNGVSIGSYSFSLADVLLAIVVLMIMLTITRMVCSLLENRLLPQTDMDIGLRNAVSSGVGYIGVTIALLMALSTMGIDLTKLALIAGALSVGIGFGLQNIVNNFVSGLVLLFERPIKIGDWVVVGNLEGKVQQIKVRSTEIETFNGATVIIPNADLLQTAVVNWTHNSTIGRIEIPIRVGFDTDIDVLEKLLLEVAEESHEVMAWPKPYVGFLEFGESSLNFQIYVYIDNIGRRLRISSQIRKMVLVKLREYNIEIPYPHQTVITELEGTDLRPEPREPRP